jgi:hypothetical protein
MKKLYAYVLLCFVATTVHSQTAVFTSATSGYLGDIGFTITNFTNTNAPSASFFNLNIDAYGDYRLSASQQVYSYFSGDQWLITFDQPVSNLVFYCGYWRGDTYTFTQPFSFLIEPAEGITATIVNNTILEQTLGWGNLILKFEDGITSLGCQGTRLSGYQLFTFGYEPNLGVDSLNGLQVGVFPNPTTDYLTVAGITEVANYSIVSTLGQTVQQGTVTVGAPLQVGSLTNGVYLLSIDGCKPVKFIKN